MADFGDALMHGGDIRGFLERYGAEPLDFSINVNPLGAPKEVQRAICDAAKDVDRYPDPLCRDLRLAIAQNEKVRAEQIYCAAGAAEIIYRLVWALRPKRALIVAPTFSEYALALKTQNCAIERHELKDEENFALTPKILPQLHDELDIVFLCNPNNPTGRCINSELLCEILKRCAKYNIRIVVDECFLGFSPHHESRTLVTFLSQYKQLIILKAFTKLYGMAGVRLGYCLSDDAQLLERLYNIGPPWNVSSLAQKSGMAALGAKDYLGKSRAIISAERPRLQTALTELGFRVINSESNFILFFSPMEELQEKLCQNGVLIRDCSNFEGLKQGWHRVVVRTPQQNDRLIQAVKACL